MNYHTDTETLAFLDSLVEMGREGPDATVVVDNSGTLAPRRASRSDATTVEVLTPSRNLGYFGAASWGLDQYLSGNPLPHWVIVSNPDISFPDRAFFAKLRDGDRPPAAVIAPDIVSTRKSFLAESLEHQNPFLTGRPSPLRIRMLELICRSYPVYAAYSMASSLRYRVLRALPGLSDARPAAPAPIYAPFGAFFIFNKSYFAAGGTLKYGVFLFGEEIFVAETARNLGLTVLYDPRLLVAHSDHAAMRLLPKRQTAAHTRRAMRYLLVAFLDRRPPVAARRTGQV